MRQTGTIRRRRMGLIALAAMAIPAGAIGHTSADTALAPAVPGTGLASVRVPFVANSGQMDDPRVGFYARTFAGTVFVTTNGQLVYSLPQKSGALSKPGRAIPIWAFRESFANAAALRPRGSQASATQVSQFKGSDPARWRRRLPAYDSIMIGQPYPGIAVTLRAAANNVEKLFRIAPGADANDIAMTVDGVDSLGIDQASRLVLNTGLGEIAFTAPVAYQTIDGEHRSVQVAYRFGENNRYGFNVGAYDPDHELIIDPLLASTFIGGHNPNPPGNYDDDIVHDMIAAGGDVYVAGATQSPDFPIVLGYDQTLGSSSPDGFIARLSGDLSTLIASTFLGTEGFDRVEAIVVEDGAQS